MLRAAAVVAALLLGGAALDGGAEAGKRKGGKGGKRGKVVRVERARPGEAGVIRVCSLIGNGGATCVGRPPIVGDRGSVMDGTAMYGVARIASVTADSDSCGNVISYAVTLDSDISNLGQLGYGTVMLLDYVASSDTRTLPMSGQAPIPGAYQGEYVFVAVDQDRDADGDFFATYYTCDASAAVVGYGQGHVGYCVRYYVGDGADWTLVRTDVVRSC